jgi:protein involved in polysaccharide export with SLBB domain
VYHRNQGKEKVAMLESKMFRVWFGAMLLMCASFCGYALRAQETQSSKEMNLETYRIGIGDHIQVTVFQHPEISKNWVVVDRNGNIALPSINVVKASGVSIIDFQPFAFYAVKASGLSILDFADGLKRKLEVIIPNPQLIVTVSPASSGESTPRLGDPPLPNCCAA